MPVLDQNSQETSLHYPIENIPNPTFESVLPPRPVIRDLPAPPSGKAYQLWAIVNGKPVSMGMYNPADKKGLVAMENVQPGTVKAFAIILEKQEGSPTPTMSQMYVMGKI